MKTGYVLRKCYVTALICALNFNGVYRFLHLNPSFEIKKEQDKRRGRKNNKNIFLAFLSKNWPKIKFDKLKKRMPHWI